LYVCYGNPVLAQIPAAIRFISYEPALAAMDFTPVLPSFHWLISGGESRAGCRPADRAWFRQVRDQCAAAGIPYFHKQHGGVRKLSEPG
jgi:protein gp37